MNDKIDRGELENYTKWIDIAIDLHHRVKGTTVPSTHSKNYYLKSCWLLARYKEMRNHMDYLSTKENRMLAGMIEDLRDKLPILKAAVNEGLIQ